MTGEGRIMYHYCLEWRIMLTDHPGIIVIIQAQENKPLYGPDFSRL